MVYCWTCSIVPTHSTLVSCSLPSCLMSYRLYISPLFWCHSNILNLCHLLCVSFPTNPLMLFKHAELFWVFYSPFSPYLIVTHCPFVLFSYFPSPKPHQVSRPHVAPTQLASLCRTRDWHVDVNTDLFLPRWGRSSKKDNIEGNPVGRRRRMYERLPGGWWVCPRSYVQVRQDQSIIRPS